MTTQYFTHLCYKSRETQLPTRKELLEVSSRPSTCTSSPFIHRGMKGVEKYCRTWVVKDKGKGCLLMGTCGYYLLYRKGSIRSGRRQTWYDWIPGNKPLPFRFIVGRGRYSTWFGCTMQDRVKRQNGQNKLYWSIRVMKSIDLFYAFLEKKVWGGKSAATVATGRRCKFSMPHSNFVSFFYSGSSGIFRSLLFNFLGMLNDR